LTGPQAPIWPGQVQLWESFSLLPRTTPRETQVSGPGLYLRQLALTNFRNYVRLGLNFGPGVTVIHGENAQGKSNLLEAVHVLATTRSLRATTDRELVYWRASEGGPVFSRLEGRIGRDGAELHVEMLVKEGEGGNGSSPGFVKQIRVNGLPTRAAQLVGQVNVVLFSPEDVSLAAGSPAGRRRYLDITNSQVSTAYLRALQRYRRVLEQRNSLLKQVRERRAPRDQLAPWNDEQAGQGAAVLAQRLRMMGGIREVVAERFRQLSGSQQTLEVAYTPTSVPASVDCRPEEPATITAQALEAAFRERLVEVGPREIELAQSLIGPHRDDFAFLLDGVDLNTYGSRGQQRLAVLALKLAESEFMQAETGERPILLLDDVLSELDPTRRAFVLDRTAGEGQTLITTTDLGDISPEFLAGAAIYHVESGAIRQAEGAGAA
jgi:DNA replication and repair protein RecF